MPAHSRVSCACACHRNSLATPSVISLSSSLLVASASRAFRSVVSFLRLFSPKHIHLLVLRFALILPGVDAQFANLVQQYIEEATPLQTYGPIASTVGLQLASKPLSLRNILPPLGVNLPSVQAVPIPSNRAEISTSPAHRQLLEALVPPVLRSSSSSPLITTPNGNTEVQPRNQLQSQDKLPDSFPWPAGEDDDSEWARYCQWGTRGHQPISLGFGQAFHGMYCNTKILWRPEAFSINGFIAGGAFGRVMHAYTTDGKDVAIKVVKKAHVYTMSRGRQHLLQEMDILRLATIRGKKCLASMLSCWDDDNFVYFAMPLYPESLCHRLFSKNHNVERESIIYAAELVIGLKQMKELGCVHRDIKPENILITREGHLVLADFGCSHMSTDPSIPLENVVMSGYVGTPSYSAPELYSTTSECPTYRASADIWSLGIVFWEMLTGNKAFNDLSEEEIRLQLIDPTFTMDCSRIANLQGRELVQQMLSLDPAMRPTIEQIIAHDYFHGMDWNAVENHGYCLEYKPTEVSVDTDITSFEPSRYEELTRDAADLFIEEQKAEVSDRTLGWGFFDFVCPPQHLPEYFWKESVDTHASARDSESDMDVQTSSSSSSSSASFGKREKTSSTDQ